MSLLSALKLPVPKHFLPPGGGASMPPMNGAGSASPPTKAATSAKGPSTLAGGGDGADPRAEAKKLRGAIEAQRKQSADLLLRMQKAEPVLKAKVDAATGAEKKTLAEKQAVLARQIADAERAVTRAQADLEAIDNPGSKREELMAILARQRAGGKVAEATEISSPGLDPYKKGKINSDVTATTTSYADGKATTEKVREQQKVGLDGYTKTQSRDKEVTDGKRHRPRRRGEEDQRLARRQGVRRGEEVGRDRAAPTAARPGSRAPRRRRSAPRARRRRRRSRRRTSTGRPPRRPPSRRSSAATARSSPRRAAASRRRASRARRPPATRARAAAWSPARTDTAPRPASTAASR